MLIDSHCHLDFYAEPGDLAAILANASAAGVERLLAIGIGDGPETMHRALELANEHQNIYASAGIHPQEAIKPHRKISRSSKLSSSRKSASPLAR